MWITRVSINNPVFATMVMIGIVVLGVFAYARLRVEQMPDVTLPFVDVETVYPGASPEVVETDVSKPIEYAVNTVSGVKRIYSNSREGRSQVFVEFRLGTDVTRAIQDARDKIALVRPNFPRDVKDPQVIRVEIEDNRPTVSLAVLSPTVELAHRSDGRQGDREHPRRRASHRQRARDTADTHPDTTLRAGVARHRHRSGYDRGAERQPGRPGRPHHAGSE